MPQSELEFAELEPLNPTPNKPTKKPWRQLE